MKNKNGSATRGKTGRAGLSPFHIFCISLMVLFYVLTVVLLATDDFPGKEIIRKFTIPFFFTTYFIVALIEGLKTYSDKKRKIFNTIVCVGNAVIFLMMRFVVSDIVTFLILAVNTVLPIYYLCYFIRYRTKYSKGFKADLEWSTVIAMILPWFYVLMSLSGYVHLDEGALFLVILICWAVLAVVFAVLSLTVFKQSYLVLIKKRYERIIAVVFGLAFIFFYSFVCVTTINTGFASERHTATYEIVEKKSTNGGNKSVKKNLLYITYNGKKIGLDVSIDLYKDKNVGERLEVYTYSGFLSLPYIVSAE